MKITLCGSLKFADEIWEAKEKLEALGHEVFMPIKVAGVDYWAEDNSDRIKAKKELDLIREHMRKIEQSDAILVVNITKQDVEDYIGANTFIEMGFAHHLGKKIFTLNPLPHQPYIMDELLAMKIVVLRGDVNKIHGA